MVLRICLPVVDPEEGKDSIVSVTEAGFPLLKGRDEDHLACGGCGEVIAWNVSRERAREMFIVPRRLLFRCRCGAHNLVRPRPHLVETSAMPVRRAEPASI
jgi:hypothetical protein